MNAANRYQTAEYHAAIARSRTALQWREFAENPEVPNLKWLPSRSADPRESHMRFYGLVLPKNHEFWRQNQPGNIWNCKCDWEETFDKPDHEKPPKGKPAQGLEGNPAQTGQIFSDNASYFKTKKTTGKLIDAEYSKIVKYDTLIEMKKLYSEKTNVEIDGNIISVEYNNRGISHIANDMISDRRNYIKTVVASQLNKFLENGKLVAWEDNAKPEKKKNADKYYYFEIVLPDGKPAYLHVEKNISGKYILYSITNTLRKTVNFYGAPPEGMET